MSFAVAGHSYTAVTGRTPKSAANVLFFFNLLRHHLAPLPLSATAIPLVQSTLDPSLE